MSFPEQELAEQLENLRGWTAEALLQLDNAKRSLRKDEMRQLLLGAGATLHGVVRELEQLLKTEPPRA